MKSEYIMIGEFTKPQGVRVEVKLRPITCDISRFEGLERVYVERDGAFVPLNIRVNRISEDAVFLNVEDIGDRNAAEKLRGVKAYVDRAHAVELDENSDFICDLIGIKGLVSDGRELGRLTEVLQPGGNDVYVFEGSLGQVLIPALRSVVLKVDYDAGEMLFDAVRFGEVAVLDEN